MRGWITHFDTFIISGTSKNTKCERIKLPGEKIITQLTIHCICVLKKNYDDELLMGESTEDTDSTS